MKKIKDIFCEQYPLKEVKYEFEAPMPEVTFALLQNNLKNRIWGGKITAIRDADDMIVGVDVVLDIPDDDAFYEKLMDIFKGKL